MYTVWFVIAILLILVFLERNMIHKESYKQPGMLYHYWGAVYDNPRFPEYRW